MDVMDKLTMRLGPLPAWAWVGVASGGVLAWRLMRGRASAAADTATGTGDAAYDSYTDDSGQLGGGGYDYGGVFPASDVRGPLVSPIDQEAADSGVPVELLDRVSALEELTATPPPSLADQLASWWNTTEVLTGYAKSLVPAAPNPAPVTGVPEVPSAPPPVSVGPTQPAAPGPKQPVSGEHVWKGASPPNMDTIRQLLISRYGRVVATRTTRPGGGGYLVVVA